MPVGVIARRKQVLFVVQTFVVNVKESYLIIRHTKIHTLRTGLNNLHHSFVGDNEVLKNVLKNYGISSPAVLLLPVLVLELAVRCGPTCEIKTAGFVRSHVSLTALVTTSATL